MGKKKEEVIENKAVEEEVVLAEKVDASEEIVESDAVEEEAPLVEKTVEQKKTVKIYMHTSVGKYNAHVRYRVCECELKNLPEGSYIVIG